MKKRIWRKKGFTLIELTVVIAVLAIISTVIVTFSSMIAAQVTRNNARANFLNDAHAFKMDLQTSFAQWDEETAFTLTVDNQNKAISFNSGEKNNTFSFAEYGEFTLSLMAQGGGLLKCIMKNPRLGLEQTFLLSSRCGARFTVMAEGTI